MVSTKVVFIYLVGISCILHETEGLQCYNCTNVSSAKDCSAKQTCLQGEKCYTSASGIGSNEIFTLGCKPDAECLSGKLPAIVGRSVQNPNSCSQCCQIDNCNRNLCSVRYQVINEVGHCEDDPTFDCAAVTALVSLCSDIHHAKLKCRKYCGLCNLIDGGWSVWEPWSRCDVTCGSGHMTRTRNCSAPAPSGGGLECVGDQRETMPCTLDTCPVHGSWSRWSSWGYCSVTCGVGLERRDRTCSNPYPSHDGDHCFGDSRDDRPCLINACADGIWSIWSDWGSCSAMCLGGLQKRSRTCDNPAPTQLGHACVGNSEVYQTCNNKECPHGLPVTFRATNVANLHVAGGRTLIYTNTEINEGGGYNSTTGIFTAPETGMYAFTAQICINHGDYYHIFILKDGHVEAKLIFIDATYQICNTISAYISMTAGNKVWVKVSSGSYDLYQTGDYINTFQGIRVRA